MKSPKEWTVPYHCIFGTFINGPHQGALIDTSDGRSWFVHFQDAGVYGRIVHLNPVNWQDDWPLMGVAVPGTNRRSPSSSTPSRLP